MQVIIASEADAVASLGAGYVVRLLRQKPDAVLGLATGSTPIALYKQLISQCRTGAVSFTRCTSFNLDEYIGIPASHPQSYRTFMEQQLFSEIDIRPENTHLPQGNAAEPKAEALEYEQKIEAAGGIDLQILGLGRNGHIGFNEPSSSLRSRTRVKTLAPETLEDNSRFFSADEFQPRLAITMGIGTILEARQILLLVTGSQKAAALKELVEGPLSANCPASALQLHQNTIIIADREAAALLSNQRYYQQVQIETDRMLAEVANG